MNMSLRIAVIGLCHGKFYIEKILATPRAKLAAMVDITPDLARSLGQEHGCAWFTSIDDLLRAGVADAAVLALPTMLHAEYSVKCLDAGLHVLQEKPLCRNEQDAAMIHQAVRRSGKVFQVGFEMRSSGLHAAVMDHITRGDLGEVTNVWYNQHCMDLKGEMQNNWRASRANMGGKFFDCSVHPMDLMRQWAGASVSRVAVLGNRRGRTGAQPEGLPQSAAIAMEYANGVRGTFNFGAVNEFRDESTFGVAGTTGRVQGSMFYPQGAGSYELRTHRGERVGHIHLDASLTSPGHLGFAEQMPRFVGTVLDGEPNVCDFDAAYETHRLMAMLDMALARGTVIGDADLPPPVNA